MEDSDLAFALSLQQEFFKEASNGHNTGTYDGHHPTIPHTSKSRSVVDSEWELIDPTPDVLALFREFNETYFWEKLNMVEVKWSKRMTLCAGLCRYEGFGGLCSIALSQPLLQLRPRKDLVETLLHEMIHAYLFVTQNNKDHDAHGAEFCKHMTRINQIAGCNITIYHSFHDEVAEQRKHWWRCQGPCQSRPPYFGYVKRAMNRAPSKTDYWWNDHERTCGGKYIKIKEPENYVKKAQKKSNITESNANDISQIGKQHRPSKANPKLKKVAPSSGRKANGNVLGGDKVAIVAGRGIPTTSRLLSKQPLSLDVDSTMLGVKEKQDGTTKAEEVPSTSRRLSTLSASLPSSSHSDSKKAAGKIEQKVKNDDIHDKCTKLSRIKKREILTNDSPVRNKKKKNNLYDFFQQMKKNGRKSVNEGAPAFQSIKPVVSFSKRAVHFDDSDDENSDKENILYSQNTPTSILRDSKLKQENTCPRYTHESMQRDGKPKLENHAVKIEKDAKQNRGDRIAIDLLDFIDDDILFDEFDHFSDTANSDKLTAFGMSNNAPGKVKIETRPENVATFNAGGDVLTKVKKENPAVCELSSLNCDDDVLFRTKSKKSKNRLTSFSDDDDETLTQVWKSHVESKKMKFDSVSDDDSPILPVFSMNNISMPSLSNDESCKVEFTTNCEAKDEVISETCNDNNSTSEKSKGPSNETTSQFRIDHCEKDAVIDDNTSLNVGSSARDKKTHDIPILGSPSKNTPESSRVSCPICGLMCSDDDIIQHVDVCLTSEESHSASQNAAYDDNKGTGTINSATSVHANIATTSNCDSKSTSSNVASAIPDSESHGGSDNNSNCVPGPSSLSANEANSSNVSCPICGISCSAETINYHIDECLSLKAINESDWD